MGSRVYSAYFNNVSVSAAQDLLSLKAGAANGIELHHVVLTAGGVTAPAEVNVRLKRLPITITAGSGGTAVTPAAIDSGDTKAATATARANDTNQATTTGTVATLDIWQWNVLGPLEHLPAPEDREICQAGEEFVIDLVSAPSAAVTLSGFVKWRELP